MSKLICTFISRFEGIRGERNQIFRTLVVTMLFHTFLASVVSKAKKKPMRLLSAKSVFNFNPNKAHRVQSSVGSGPGITNVESHQDVGTQG